MANFEVKVFDRDNFLSDLNKGKYPFINYALEIIGSYERNQNNVKKGFSEFLSDTYEIFADSKNACGFVLLKDDKPVSFTMFENRDFDGDVLVTTMIWTRKGYEGLGYARSLLSNALSYYANNTDCQKCYSTINRKNEKSISMHDYFIRNGLGREFIQDVGDDDNKLMCELDIPKFKDNKEFVLLQKITTDENEQIM